MPAVLAVIGVIFLLLAGVGVSAPRFQPQWLGFACLAAALCWAPITSLGG